MKRLLVILSLVLSFLLLQLADGGTAASLARGRDADTSAMPSCMMVLGYDETRLPDIPDSLFNALAGITIYKVNSTELRADDPFVGLLDKVVIPLANENDWTILGMEVRGGASPEGPYDNNVRLANGRAANILKYINKRLVHKFRADEVHLSTVPEDYAYLLWMLERDGDPAAIVLREIINRRGINDHAAIKADMRKVDGGRFWNRLLKDYFPLVRAGRVMLFFAPYRPLVDVPPVSDLESTSVSLPSPALRAIPSEFLYPPLTLVERRHMLSIGSNILYDAFYMPQYGWAPMPNVDVELFPKTGNFSFRFQFLFPYYHRWSRHKFFQIRDYHLEVRRYFDPGFYNTGWYLGAYANANKYGIGLSATKGWEGEGAGAALKAGYVVRLGRNKRWRLDFHVAVGAYVTRYDPYVYGNPITGEFDGDYYYDWTGGSEAFRRRNHRLTWFGPAEAGVTISYDALFWRNSRPGVSFISQEYCR